MALLNRSKLTYFLPFLTSTTEIDQPEWYVRLVPNMNSPCTKNPTQDSAFIFGIIFFRALYFQLLGFDHRSAARRRAIGAGRCGHLARLDDGRPHAAPYLGIGTKTRASSMGTTREDERVLVDDGTCPNGQIKEFIGGNQVKVAARNRSNVNAGVSLPKSQLASPRKPRF